jgi:prepilin signal peptidase PulO-like enzyme (type II secretory pathway)
MYPCLIHKYIYIEYMFKCNELVEMDPKILIYIFLTKISLIFNFKTIHCTTVADLTTAVLFALATVASDVAADRRLGVAAFGFIAGALVVNLIVVVRFVRSKLQDPAFHEWARRHSAATEITQFFGIFSPQLLLILGRLVQEMWLFK